MIEKLVRVFNTPFGYTEKQIRSGIENIRSDLQRYRTELAGEHEGMKEVANQRIPDFEMILEYVNGRTPAQMIGELRAIYSLITTLESGGVNRQGIGEILLDRYRDQILIYQPIFNQGWIETALQTIAIEVTRRNT